MSKEVLSPGIKSFLIYGVVLNLLISVGIVVWQGLFPAKIVYVDVVKLMNGYKGMEEAKREFTVKTEIWQANLDTLRIEVEQAIGEYERGRGKASKREIELLEKIVFSKQQQFNTYEQNIKEQFQKQDQELSKKVLDKVNDFIKRYGKAHGYTFIMAATQYGNIVYAEDYVDITQDVLEGLNSEFASK